MPDESKLTIYGENPAVRQEMERLHKMNDLQFQEEWDRTVRSFRRTICEAKGRDKRGL